MPPGSAHEGGPALRVAYLADRYPLLTFPVIWREVQALRASETHVEPFALREPEPVKIIEGEEFGRTSFLAGAGPAALLGVQAAALARSPVRFARALALALRTRPPGRRGPFVQLTRLAWAALLAQRLRARGVSHVHVHGAGAACTVAMLAAALGGISFSMTVHGSKVFREVETWHLGEKLRRARFARCISHFTRGQCLPWLPPERWNTLHVVHCGVDPGAYALRCHQGRGTNLLFVGRPSVWKGFPFLIDAFARLRAERPDLRLTVVGDGPERREQEARVRAAGLEGDVVFTGYQSEKQVADWLERADVLVLPSLIEGVPVVLMEAGAAGLPVVATNVGGVSELVTDGVSGFLVPPGSADALVAPIQALLDDPAVRRRMGRAGREAVVRDFDVSREAGRLREVLAAALAPR